MKKVYNALACVFLISVMCISVCAIEARAPGIDRNLTFSGGTAYCEAAVTSAGEEIVATMKLRGEDAVIATWRETGMSYVELAGECAVTERGLYTLEVSGTIGGEAFSESITETY